jgi:uncharacterized RDD family membrane protein YckC
MNKPIENKSTIKHFRLQYLAALTLLVILGELVFKYQTASEIEAIIIKVFIIVLPLVFVYFGYKWAIWTSSIILVLNGILIIESVFIYNSPILGIVGLLNILLAITPFISKKIKSIFLSPKVVEKIDDNEPAKETFKDFDYPYLLTRIKASLIDGVVLACFLGFLLALTPNPESRPIAAVIFAITVLLYEPVLLSIFSATIGHTLMGIKVINFIDNNRKLNILQGIIRVFTKYILGWLSFLTINFNNGHRAIHDYLSSGVVVKNIKKTAHNKV